MTHIGPAATVTGVTETSREFVEKLLLRAEAGVHKRGWDQPAFISILGWLPGGTRRLAMAQLPFPLGNPVGAYVAHHGEHMLADDRLGVDLARELGADFFGFAVVTEAYAYAGQAEELRALHEANKHMGDVPGAVEIRVVSAVDIHGRPYYIQRTRGQKPIARQDWTIGGDIFTGLGNMVKAVVQQLPDNQQYLAGLATLADQQRKAEAFLHAEVLDRVNESPGEPPTV